MTPGKNPGKPENPYFSLNYKEKEVVFLGFFLESFSMKETRNAKGHL